MSKKRYRKKFKKLTSDITMIAILAPFIITIIVLFFRDFVAGHLI